MSSVRRPAWDAVPRLVVGQACLAGTIRVHYVYVIDGVIVVRVRIVTVTNGTRVVSPSGDQLGNQCPAPRCRSDVSGRNRPRSLRISQGSRHGIEKNAMSSSVRRPAWVGVQTPRCRLGVSGWNHPRSLRISHRCSHRRSGQDRHGSTRNAIRCPSGDQLGKPSHPPRCRLGVSGPEPSAFITYISITYASRFSGSRFPSTYISQFSSRYDSNAIRCPSGEKLG